MNEHFYRFIRWKVKNDITFNNHTNLNQQAKHRNPELAIVLSTVDDQVAYPTITIMDRNYSILFQQSYLKRKTLFLSWKKKRIPIFEKNSSN
jgi:hypothetical protein